MDLDLYLYNRNKASVLTITQTVDQVYCDQGGVLIIDKPFNALHLWDN